MRNRLSNELAVCGYNAVKALSEMHPNEINRFFLREELLPEFSQLCKLLASKRHPYKLCADDELERLCKSPRHQGLVAMIGAREIQALEQERFREIIEKGEHLLVLDDVGNDNNLGAIARSAAFFGIRHIIINLDEGEPWLTTSAHRVAEGGLEHVSINSVRNLAAFLSDAAKEMIIIGASHRARHTLQELHSVRSNAATKIHGAASSRHGLGASIPLAIVLGNEEHGLSDAVAKACTALIRIPGSGAMESLNVAQAANLFMYELFRSV